MNLVTIKDVVDNLEEPLNPKFFQVLKKKKLQAIQDFTREKIDFILRSESLVDQLPEYPCSSNMYSIFRDNFLEERNLQTSEWMRVLSSPDILECFISLTPKILSYVPPELFSSDDLALRMFKYNLVFLKNLITKSFKTYDRVLTYSVSANELSYDWFFQTVNPSFSVEVFAPVVVGREPGYSNRSKYRKKQISLLQLWSLNAELNREKITSQLISGSDFVDHQPNLRINPPTPFNQSHTHSSFSISDSQIAELRSISPVDNDEPNTLDDVKPEICFSLVDETLIGKEAIFNYPGYGDVRVTIQNFSVNFTHIYLEIKEDNFPGNSLIVVETSQVAEKLTADKSWLNPEKLKIIA